jgi:DNA-binding response OmpR family regulator
MNISIIDDEKILANKTSKKLEKHWYSVNVYNSCRDFFNVCFIESDLYIIDLGLGDGSWFDIIKWLRIEKQSKAPIIITSAYSDSEKKIYGLDIGADDYMTKPFFPDELLARVKAQLRRKNNLVNDQDENIFYKNIVFEKNSGIVKVWGIQVTVTKKERQLIHLFLSHAWKLIPKNKIIFSIWDSTDFDSVSDNTINVTISKIRKKLGEEFNLKTRVNAWYILEL